MVSNEMKTKSKAKKNVKKSFYEVSAQMISTPIQLYAQSKESLEGRTVKIDLTKNLRGKSLELKLRIKLDGEQLIGIPESVELVKSHIRRMMRSGTDYCEDSFVTNCKDFSVQIKPFLITRKRVSRGILNSLRQNSNKFLRSHVKTREVSEIFSEIITNKLQKQLSLKLKKIYPLALCEIRMFKIVGKVNPKEVSENFAEEKTE